MLCSGNSTTHSFPPSTCVCFISGPKYRHPQSSGNPSVEYSTVSDYTQQDLPNAHPGLESRATQIGFTDVVRSFPFPVRSVCCVKASEAAQVSLVYVIGVRQHDPEMAVFLTDGQGFWTVLDGLYSSQSAVNECRLSRDLTSHDHGGVDIISVERQDGFEV